MENFPKILVVDDDLEITIMLKIMLEHKGMYVITINRTDQIPQILSNHKIDLIILDMLIAGVKGNELCNLLKKDAATAHYPIMMMTALPDAEKVCRENGADDFIAKPFEMMHMISKINKLTQYQNNPE
jgi:DNA-binding response OmpR family regulator